MSASEVKVLAVFGTRPEAIKMAPVVKRLARAEGVRMRVCVTAQHREMLDQVLNLFEIVPEHDLDIMRSGQDLYDISAAVMTGLKPVLRDFRPDLVLVHGDTSTTLAASLAAYYEQIAVGHVEAGLRSGNLMSPFPEEMNRRVVSQMTSFHFASTEQNRRALVAEGVSNEKIFVTGNPVVDSLKQMLKNLKPSEKIAELIEKTEGKKRILLTTHRRESFGEAMGGNLMVLRDFADRHADVAVFFPVHPNPNVRKIAKEILGERDNVFLLEPLDYSDFLFIMKAAWLIVSDSGGVQEEAPSLGKPLLVIRENTERPEAISAGVAKLVGTSPGALKQMLEENYSVDTWIKSVKEVANPFGDGRSALRIVRVIEEKLASKTKAKVSQGKLF